MSILVNYTNILDVRVQQNQAYLADNLFYNPEFKKLTYYNAGKKEFRYENLVFNEDMIMRVYVNLDRELVSFERNVYSFLDMFGFLGGILKVQRYQAAMRCFICSPCWKPTYSLTLSMK